MTQNYVLCTTSYAATSQLVTTKGIPKGWAVSPLMCDCGGVAAALFGETYFYSFFHLLIV